MEWADITAILFNALIGATAGALLLKKVMPKIAEYLFSKKIKQFKPAITFAFVMLCSFLGVYFEIVQGPNILLDLALHGYPMGIAGVGGLMVFLIGVLYYAIQIQPAFRK